MTSCDLRDSLEMYFFTYGRVSEVINNNFVAVKYVCDVMILFWKNTSISFRMAKFQSFNNS